MKKYARHIQIQNISIAISKNVDGLSVCEDFFENPVAAIFVHAHA